MADNLVIYTIVHQPRRLRLPAYRVPREASIEELERALFDDTLNKFYLHKVAKYCYHPASDLFLDLVRKGLRLSIGFSISFLDQAIQWDPPLVDKFKRLVSHPNVELVCVEPYHSFVFYMDIDRFQERMAWARDRLQKIFNKRPVVAETTEMFMSREIYHALDRLGFVATLCEGRSKVLGWRSPAYLYRHHGKNLALLVRHKELSDDVGYRFSQKTWPGYPLTAQQYVDWIKMVPGDLVFIGWDFETFGEHHSVDTGIFEFLKWMAGEVQWRGVETLTISQAVEKFHDSSYEIELPVVPTTWAGLNGDPRFFLGNQAQFQIFLHMSHAYSVAHLTGDVHLIDIALQMCQSDNLHLLQWLNSNDSSEAEVSSYFTPGYWWNLGASRIPVELQNVYQQFITFSARKLEKQAVKRWPAARAKRGLATNVGAYRHDEVVKLPRAQQPETLPLASDGNRPVRSGLSVSSEAHEPKLLVRDDGTRCSECEHATADGCALSNCILTVAVK